MALILVPLGPVTSTQAPHSAALSQRWEERAVPKRPEGMVYSVNEQVPPETLPP